jgi:hypothetical protein
MSTRIVDMLHLRRPPAVAFVPDQTQPRALIAPVDTRIGQLMSTFRYVHVTVDPHFEPVDCEWCDGQGTTSVRVYGAELHDEHVECPLEMAEVCLACALKTRGPIWQAGTESRSDRDIQVEVCA